MKPFTTVASVVLALVALAQLLRVLMAWEVSVAGLIVPYWISVLACLIAATLAFMVRRENRT
jgi:hypothetical protein